MINADGTDLQKLAGGVVDPVVSPDGKQMAYTRWDGARFGAVYVLDLDTAPVFSPDGQTLALTKRPILADPQYSSAAPA